MELDSRRHGFEKTESGLNVRPIDLAKLGANLISADEKVVSDTWLEQSTLDQTAGDLLGKKFAPIADRIGSRGATELADHVRSSGMVFIGGESSEKTATIITRTDISGSSCTLAPTLVWSSYAMELVMAG